MLATDISVATPLILLVKLIIEVLAFRVKFVVVAIFQLLTAIPVILTVELPSVRVLVFELEELKVCAVTATLLVFNVPEVRVSVPVPILRASWKTTTPVVVPAIVMGLLVEENLPFTVRSICVPAAGLRLRVPVQELVPLNLQLTVPADGATVIELEPDRVAA